MDSKAANVSPNTEGAPTWPALLLIAVAVGLCYSNTFQNEFIFDDWPNIIENPSIRRLWPLGGIFHPPEGTSVTGRPVANLTFALNYAVSGEQTWSYHLFNIAIHVGAALTLFGIIRRTLSRVSLSERFGLHSRQLALAVALIWGTHPIHTQAVTYITQRCESLMGLFFFLTLYCAIRGWEHGKRKTHWHTLAILACLIGVGTKETIAVAPFLVFLYDIIFVHNNVRNALRESVLLYSGFFGCLIVLVVLVAGGGTAGGAIGPYDPLEYALTQPEVILYYVRLLAWPSPLCLDYAWPISTIPQAFPYAIVLLLMMVVTLWATVRKYPSGFLGLWFFFTLAPTSSFIPLPDLAFEYRMYLPSAAFITFFVIAAYGVVRTISNKLFQSDSTREYFGSAATIVIVSAIIVFLHTLTFFRNQDYRSEISIWTDTIEKQPNNARAYTNLGCALVDGGNSKEAIQYFENALAINRTDAKTHNGLANAYSSLGRFDKAIHHYRRAIEIDPDYVEAYYNLGKAYCEQNEFDKSISCFQKSLSLDPNYADAYNNLGLVYAELGQAEKAIAYYRRALSINPESAETLNNLGNLITQTRGAGNAIQYYKKALSLDPDYSKAHNNLGLAYLHLGQTESAIIHFKEAIRLDPSYANAHNNLGAAYVAVGDLQKAVAQFHETLRIDPEHLEARKSLERLGNMDSSS